MKRTITIVIAAIASFALAAVVFAEERTPHGYNAKVAAEQAAKAKADTAGYIVLSPGPRPQDNPLRGKKIAIAKPEQQPAAVTASSAQKQ